MAGWTQGKVRILRSLTGRLWRFLSSTRLALFLILTLVALSLVGVFIIQAPSDLASDPRAFELWIANVARPKFGVATGFLAALHFFDIFHSPWFLAAGSLLLANIIACSLTRTTGLKLLLRGPSLISWPRDNPGTFHQFSSTDAKQSADEMVRVLRGKGYRVRSERTQAGVSLAAEKNAFSRLGTYLVHVSIVLVVGGLFMGNFAGFRDSLAVVEGSTEDVGHGTGMSLFLESFSQEYWPEGVPRDYRSQVILYQGGKEVRRADIRVNHPLVFEGIRFHQAFFGPAVVIEARSEGKVLFQGPVALTQAVEIDGIERPAGTFELEEIGATVLLIGPSMFDPILQQGEIIAELSASDAGTMVAWGKLQLGVPGSMGGVELAFREQRQFSGLQVSEEPGSGLLWAGVGLFVVGLMAFFYFPHRRVWGLFQPYEGRTRILFKGLDGRRKMSQKSLEDIIGPLRMDSPERTKRR